jgi:hypothetical protein
MSVSVFLECHGMKLKNLMGGNFIDSFSKLLDGGIMVLSPKTVFRLKKIDQKIKDEFKLFNDTREQYLKELAVKDDNNQPIIIKHETDNSKSRYDLTPENKIIINGKIIELLDLDFDIGLPIAYSEIEKVNLNVKDLIILDGIIADPID